MHLYIHEALATLMKNQNRCVYQLYFRDYQISLTIIHPYKRISSKSLAIAFAVLEKPHMKTLVVIGKIMKTIELYHTGMPFPLNNYATFFGFTL
jgi:hypothetical protein